MVLSGGKLAGGNPKKKRVDNDFYATNPKAVEMLLKQESFECNNILEPCVGNGNIAAALKLHNPPAKILGIDIVDRGYPKTLVSDFLTLDIPLKFDTIITNPPFSLAKEFVEKSLTHLTNTGKCAMFLKIQFLEGSKRKEFFKKYPPKYIYVFRNRMATWNDGNPTDPETGKAWATTMCHAWFVWENGSTSEPVVRWL